MQFMASKSQSASFVRGSDLADSTPAPETVAAPCYFKIEPGVSEAALYKPYVREDFHQYLVREKVKMASIIRELAQRINPGIKCSGT